LQPPTAGPYRGPHIHITVGLKENSATAHTSHLLDATVQFLTEMLIIEITSPTMHRLPNPDLYDVPQLHFSQPSASSSTAATTSTPPSPTPATPTPSSRITSPSSSLASARPATG